MILAAVVAVVALVYSWKLDKPKVTICGLDLQNNRESVAATLEPLDYRHFSPGQWQERWYHLEGPGLDIVYDEAGSVYRLEGGCSEIDGRDASRWTAGEFQAVLGPSEGGGTSGAVGEARRPFLSYPKYRLLIYLEPEGNRFILFESGR